MSKPFLDNIKSLNKNYPEGWPTKIDIKRGKKYWDVT